LCDNPPLARAPGTESSLCRVRLQCKRRTKATISGSYKNVVGVYIRRIEIAFDLENFLRGCATFNCFNYKYYPVVILGLKGMSSSPNGLKQSYMQQSPWPKSRNAASVTGVGIKNFTSIAEA